MRFDSRGMAYACADEPVFPSGGFAAEFLLEPAGPRLDGAGELISFYGKDGVIIGAYHWRDSVIVSSTGAHKYETGARSVLLGKKRRLLTVSAGKEGIWVYADGRKMGGTARPFNGIEKATCFTFGNSPDGRMPWKGRLLSLSLSGVERANKDASNNGQGLVADYSFNGTGGLVRNRVSDKLDISVPDVFRAARAHWLEPLFEPYKVRLSAKDVAINFLGFIPGGFLCFFLASGRRAAVRMFIAVLAGFFLSLGIETAQVCLPERYSQLSDLAINTAGAAFGAIAAFFSMKTVSRLID